MGLTILAELRRIGAVLIRRKKHQVWRLPDGRIYVMAATPGDWRAERNQLRDLRRMLQAKR